MKERIVHRSIVLGALALGAALAPRAALAVDTAGAFQIGLGTNILGHNSGTFTTEVPGDDQESDLSSTEWGFGSNVMLELGYGLSSEMVLGGVLTLHSVSAENDPDGPGSADGSVTRVRFGPKFDYMFSPQESLRPFIGGTLAYVSLGTDDDFGEASLKGLELGVRGGLRWFANETLSIDPQLGLGFLTTSGERELGPTDVDISYSGFYISLGVAMSAWL